MENIIKEIRKQQDELILMINSTFDKIVKDVSKYQKGDVSNEEVYDMAYPITNTSGFKNKKAIAVVFKNKQVTTPTWKKVVEEILDDAIKDDKRKKALYSLRGKFLGRKRTILSTTSVNMRSPLEIDKGLYLETHYDTETLMNLLLQILTCISYDYSNINIIIKNR